MKKLLLLFLLIAGGVSTASADDYYVVGSLVGDNWTYQPSQNNATHMTASTSTGIYYFDCTPTAGEKYFHIADGDGIEEDWSDYNSDHRYSSGTVNEETNGGKYSVPLGKNGDRNLKLTADGSTTYRIILDAVNMKLTVTKLNQDYIAAGVFNHNGEAYTSNPVFTSNWSATATSNALTIQEDGTYSKTYNVVLPVGGDIVYKVVKDKDWNTATADNQSYRIFKAGTYEVKITLYINNLNGPVMTVTETTSGGDFFLLGNNDGWAVSGEALTNNGDNTYSKTFTNSKGYTFIIAPSSALAADITWGNCIRPVNSTTVSFENYEETKYSETDGNQNWTINTDESVTLTYNSLTGVWQINCAPRTTSIGLAGYITYSNGEKCTISGAKAYKVSANNTTSVTLTEMSAETVWPANEGMILKGSNGDVVTISAVANNAPATTINDNFLVGSGNSSITPDTGDNFYVFSWDGEHASTVGFYKATGGTLDAHKAYLNLGRDSFNAHEFLGFSFDGDVTAIENLTPAIISEGEGVVYNLQGQRVKNSQKGLFIVNGKKIVRK